MVRAPVSKTGGWGFEFPPLLPSHLLSVSFSSPFRKICQLSPSLLAISVHFPPLPGKCASVRAMPSVAIFALLAACT